MPRSKQDNSSAKRIADLLFKSEAGPKPPEAGTAKSGEGAPSVPAAAGDGSEISRHGDGRLGSDGFAGHLAEVLGKHGKALSGKIHVVNLGRLRQHYGKKWPTIRRYVEQLVCQVIERNISKDDFYSCGEDLTFFLVLPHLIKKSAQLMCALIAQEVFEVLLNELAETGELDIRTLVVALDGRVGFERGHHLEALAALFAKRLSGGDQEISQRLQVVSEKALLKEEGERAQAKASGQLPPPQRPAAKTQKTLDRPRLPGTRIDLPDEAQIIYKPIWNVKNRVITNYLVDLAWLHPDGRLVTRERPPSQAGTAPTAERLELALLQRSAEILSAIQNKGRQSVLTVPVSTDTVVKSELWTPYQLTCRAIPEPLRKFVVFEIVGLTAATVQAAFDTIVGALRPFCRAVLVRLPLETKNFSSMTNAHVHAVGVGLDAYSLPEAEIIAKFDRFVERASGFGLRTYVHGLSSISLTTAAVCSGFDYFDGNAIRSPLDGPDGVFPLDLENLYKGLLNK